MPHFPSFGLSSFCLLRVPDDGLAHMAGRLPSEDGDLIRLDAIVTDNYISGSDPALQVRAPDGVNWTIELASRSRNRDAGLTESQALPGDLVAVVGRQISHFGENRIKAQRLTIAGRSFDLSAAEELQAG